MNCKHQHDVAPKLGESECSDTARTMGGVRNMSKVDTLSVKAERTMFPSETINVLMATKQRR